MESDPDELPAACEEVRAVMGAFLGAGSSVSPERRAAMRAHVEACAACAEAYRAMGDQMASMKFVQERRNRIELRREAGLGAPRGGRGMGAMSVLFAGGRQPSNGFLRAVWRLRPVVLVALVIWVITLVAQIGQTVGFEVERLAGRVVVDGRVMTDEAPERQLGRTATFETFDGRCRIGGLPSKAWPLLEAELAPHTIVLMSERNPPRFLLSTGAFTIDGAFELIAEGLVLQTPGLGGGDGERGVAAVTVRTGRADDTQAAPVVDVLLERGRLTLTTGARSEDLIGPARFRFNALGEPLPVPPPAAPGGV